MDFLTTNCKDCNDVKVTLNQVNCKIQELTRDNMFNSIYLTDRCVDERQLKDLTWYQRILHNLTYECDFYSPVSLLSIVSQAKKLSYNCLFKPNKHLWCCHPRNESTTSTSSTSTSTTTNTSSTTSTTSTTNTTTTSTSTTSTTSTTTTTTTAPELFVSWYFGDTDYFAALNGGTDAVPYNGSTPITHNAPISINFPVGAEVNKYEVIRIPSGESIKTTWFNTPLNNGTIPDAIFRSYVTIGGFKYIISRVAMSIDSSQPMIFS